MNKELLRQLQARHEKRLSDLQGKIESGEVREADLDSVNEEIDGLIDELKAIKAELGMIIQNLVTVKAMMEPLNPIILMMKIKKIVKKIRTKITMIKTKKIVAA